MTKRPVDLTPERVKHLYFCASEGLDAMKVVAHRANALPSDDDEMREHAIRAIVQ